MLRTIWLTLVLVAVLVGMSREVVASKWLFVSLLREKKIVTFERDEGGQLHRRGETECTAEPAFMSCMADRRILFVSYRSTGELASFHIDPKSGKLTPISVVDGGEDPAYLLPDRTGRYLLSAYYVASKVTVHGIGKDGSLSKQALQTIPTADKAHGFVLDTKNKFAFVPHTGANRIYQFKFNEKNGKLSASDPPFLATPQEDHPRHMVMHPSDRWAYTSNEAGDSIGVFAVDRKSATLKRIQTVTTLPDDFDGSRNATARCEITPDGKFVYIANRGHDSIAGFAIDQETGLVKSLGQTPGEATPRSFTITPSGKFLYVAGQGSGRIAAFRIEKNGDLKRLATYESGPVSWWALSVDTD